MRQQFSFIAKKWMTLRSCIYLNKIRCLIIIVINLIYNIYSISSDKYKFYLTNIIRLIYI